MRPPAKNKAIVEFFLKFILQLLPYQEGDPNSSTLVNNPNQGGLLIEGGPHNSGKIVSWKFKLLPLRKPATPKDRYALKTSNKSIFYYKHPLPNASSSKK